MALNGTKAGDYSLKGFEHLVAIERKGSVAELYKNLMTEDRTRFSAAIDRLMKVKYHWLLLDIPWREFNKPLKLHNGSVVQGNQVQDALYRFTAERNIPLLWGGNAKQPKQREELGHQMVKLMINYIWADHMAQEKRGMNV